MIWATVNSWSCFCWLYRPSPTEGNGNPLQYYCLVNPMDGGSSWAAIHGVVNCRTWLSDISFAFHFPALEKEMATHSSVLAWSIPGTEEPGRLPFMGLHRVRHYWSDLAAAVACSFSVFAFKEYNQSGFDIDYLMMSMCRVISCVVGRGCLQWSVLHILFSDSFPT